MRHHPALIAGITAVISIGIVAVGTAHAYPIASGAPGGIPGSLPSGSLNDIFAPFGNFIKNINSVSITVPPVGVPPIPQNSTITDDIRNAFQQFDAWLYGIAGFHISGLLTAILNIFSWLLGILKDGIDWLLGVIH